MHSRRLFRAPRRTRSEGDAFRVRLLRLVRDRHHAQDDVRLRLGRAEQRARLVLALRFVAHRHVRA